MDHKKARTLRDTLMITGFLVMLTGYVFGVVSTVIGSVIMFSCLIPDFLYNKCPHCKKHLGRNEGTFCQHCGGRID